MSYRVMMILFCLGYVIFGAIFIGAFYAPQLVVLPSLPLVGGVIVVSGLIGFGMSIMLPRHVSCPHCERSSALHLHFWTGRPSLKIDEAGEPVDRV